MGNQNDAAASHGFRLGWAQTDITPDRPVQLHGQFHERVSQSVHDRLTATALAISSGDADEAPEQAILIACDLVNIGHDIVLELQRRLAERVSDFDARKLLVNCTHTHTGPTLMDGLYPEPADGVMHPSAYRENLVDRLVALAQQAWDARSPAAISSALGHAAVGFNRRVSYVDGRSQMYGTSDAEDFVGSEGGIDPGVEILFTWDADDTLTGVMVNLACPSQVVEGKVVVSADFWHPAREELRRRLGADVFVYPMCSAAGDQSPRDLVRRNRGEPSMRDVDGMNEMGRRIALAVADAFEHAQGEKTHTPVFRHVAEDLPLPKRKATAEEAEAARAALPDLLDADPDPASKDSRVLKRTQQVIERFETQGECPTYTADIHLMRLDRLAIATNPFELFLDYGLRIKARCKALQTFVVQLTNDRGLYLPTDRAVAGGHYGAMVNDNLVGPEGGQVLVDRTVATLNAFWSAGKEA